MVSMVMIIWQSKSLFRNDRCLHWQIIVSDIRVKTGQARLNKSMSQCLVMTDSTITGSIIYDRYSLFNGSYYQQYVRGNLVAKIENRLKTLVDTDITIRRCDSPS